MTTVWSSIKDSRRSAHRPRRRPVVSSSSVRFRPRFELVEDRTLLSTFLVTTTDDGGPGSLRQAILDSNEASGGTATIDFKIPSQGVQTIAPGSPLPAITQVVLIDGFSQPGYAGTPLIEIDGTQAGTGDGLTITGPDVTVRGLDINNFSQGAGIHITGTAATGNWIYGNFLGTDPTGTQAAPNNAGVEIDAGASNNLIGTNGDGVNDTAERNLLSGDLFAGVLITGQGASNNAVAGNYIGTDITGSIAIVNGTQTISDSGGVFGGGVVVAAGASGNRIGTDGKSIDDVGERNVIAGSNNDAIDIYGTGTDHNVVAGNFIGTDVTGTHSLGVYGDGVFLAEGASSNWIGVNPSGVTADEGNDISDNGFDGMQIAAGSDNNVVAGNDIEANVTGTFSFANPAGIDIEYSSGNTIGGDSAPMANLITNNNGPGVLVLGADSLGNQITANRIFDNVAQAIDLGGDGVTENAPAPRVGPNHLQNYPFIVTKPEGTLQGWLGGSEPDASYRIDFFAGASFAADGSGEAQQYLGSLQVTTDGTGQAVFNVPYAPPVGLPIVTATATDPQGNTSEVSALRRATLSTPPPSLRAAPDRPLVFSVASGEGFSIKGPDVGPLEATWSITLSVTSGSLTLTNTRGLRGSGDGTGSLSYSGPLSAVDGALDDLTYTPPAGAHVFAVLSLDARSNGFPTLASQYGITDGVFVVTTRADSGPGSLRQAILDSNTVTGGSTTIEFDIPGSGVQSIVSVSPLPAISTSVLIDGATQPGYTGMPLIAIETPETGGVDCLTTSGSEVTLSGITTGALALGNDQRVSTLVVQSGFLAPGAAARIASYRIDTTSPGVFTAEIDSLGPNASLALLDSKGNLLTESDGVSASDRHGSIDEYLPAGTYSLITDLAGVAGSYSLKTTLAPASVPLQAIPVGTYPDAIVAGDFNGDGRTDLAVANGSDNTVSVLLGNGDGTFRPQRTYAVGANASAITAADFTGDGRTDLAVACWGAYPYSRGSVSVLLGNGDGTFQPQVTYAVGSQPDAIVAGDFTGNGRIDLAVANYADDTLWMLLGNGDGTFQPQFTCPVGSGPEALVAGDFTGSGHLDLAVANSGDNNVTVLLGNGDGTFQPKVNYAVGSSPAALVAGDFTGDGRTDLAVTNYGDYTLSVLLGNGDGTFQAQVTYAVGFNPGAIVVGDFTGNGRLDLAVANPQDHTVSVLLGNGDGSFRPPRVSYLAAFAFALVAGDFNVDGRTDLAVANEDDTVSVVLGNGDGTFQMHSSVSTGGGPSGVVSGDFTNDGRLDLAVVNNFDSTLSVLLGAGDGTFQPQVTYAAGAGPSAIVAGDFNGDGRTDLAVGSGDTVSILLGNGDGTFQPQVTYAVGGAEAIVTGDFNGDGRTDLAVTGGDNTVSVLLGNGDGTFQPQVTYAAGLYPFDIVAGDFTGNGRTDLAVANVGDNTVSVLLGNGDGTFQPQVTYAVGSGPAAIVSGDLNGDGRTDLAVANAFDNTVSVLLGNGDGTFRPQHTYTVGVHPNAIAAGDFTGGGHIDLAVANEGSSNVSVLLGNGDGTFQPQVTYAAGLYPFAIVAGDFTGNGRTDLAVVNRGDDTVSVLLGNGDGTFFDPGKAAISAHSAPVVADVNGDGTQDVLVLDSAGNILYRQGIPGQPGGFEPPVTINPGAPSHDIAWVPETDVGPVLASVDARDNAVMLYAWRSGRFVPIGSLRTGRLPSQVIAADLNGDGRTDIVVRNAADGTLSVFLGKPFDRGSFLGPINPQFAPPRFSPSLTLDAGLGVSDVQAIDTTGSGRLDLVVTNQVTGQVGILPNLDNGTFGRLEPHRAGTGLSAVDPSASPEVISLDATDSVAAGPLMPGVPIDLVTTNPGSNTLGVLAGLGGGRFANPVAIDTPHPAQVVRLADLTGTGIPDLLLLRPSGLAVMVGDGKGGFKPPVTYDAGAEPTGLTVTDINGDGIPDLLVSSAYGDLLVLLGKGDATFEPYRLADRSVALAVADLSGNGSKDIIFADQGLDRVVVDYGAGKSSVLANQSTGLLSPGAVKLADLNGDGIPDLIVANSGSNNVLIYPGLGNGQFGPAINGGHGYFVGTNPMDITVANLSGALPDLVVADKGSNQVSILLNTSQQGGAISFNPGPRLNSGGTGPVSTVVGHFTGSANQDILVTNSGSNNVALLPGVGGGFFNDTNPQTFAVGNNPGPLFVGNFDGRPDLVTVNAGSNDLTLISDFMSPDSTTSTIGSGGSDPDAAFSFSSSSGFDNLVVGNGGDGVLALFEGGADGLTLTSSETDPDLPSPSALVYAGMAGGQVQFYAATEGREAAALVALSLGGEIAAQPGPLAPTPPVVAQLVALQETSLAIVGTLLIVTLPSTSSEVSLESPETEAAAAVSLSSAMAVSVGQGLTSQSHRDDTGSDGDEPDAKPDDANARAAAQESDAAPWKRFILGTDEALERFNHDHPELFPTRRKETPQSSPADGHGALPAPSDENTPLGQGESTTSGRRFDAIDHAIELMDDHEPLTPESSIRRVGETHQTSNDIRIGLVGFTHPTDRSEPVGEGRFDVSAALALAATVAGELYFRSTARGANTRPRIAGTYGWFIQEGRKTNHKGHQEHKEDKEAITNTCRKYNKIHHFFSL